MVLPSRSSLLLAALAVSSSSTSLAAPAPDSRINDVAGNQLVASRSGPMDSFIISPVGEHSTNVKEPRDAPENCKGLLHDALKPLLGLLPLRKRAQLDGRDAAQEASAQGVLSTREQSMNGTDTTSVQPTSTMMPRDEPTTNGTISSSASTPSMTDGAPASQAMLDPPSGTAAPPNTPVSSDTNTVPSATPSSSVSNNVGRRGLADLGNNTETGTPTNSTILPTNTA